MVCDDCKATLYNGRWVAPQHESLTAQNIVDHLLETELDSLEAVPDYDDWRTKAFDPKTPEHRAWRLIWQKPTSPREAQALGVNWYIKQGRKYTFSLAEPEHGGYPRNSHTMATNRNLRRKSFGYRDTYSVRERDWPSGGNAAFYRRQDRARQEREARANDQVLAALGIGI